jgi:hypothetical protein
MYRFLSAICDVVLQCVSGRGMIWINLIFFFLIFACFCLIDSIEVFITLVLSNFNALIRNRG